MRFPTEFDEKKVAILSAMYEVANGTYDSYTLAQKLNPTVQAGTSPASLAFIETREATEGLIADGLVSGERLAGADGVYFKKLKLTHKGERSAIQHRGMPTSLDVRVLMDTAAMIRGDKGRQEEENKKAWADDAPRMAEVPKDTTDKK
jgi:hypothetical protein